MLYHSGQSQSHRRVGERSSKLFPVTATYQGISNSYFYSCICWIKSILFKITALTFEPFRQTASGSTLFFCWKRRKKNRWHVINRTRQNLKSEWHSLLNNELQILCSKLLYHSNGMGGFREDSNLFCLSTDLLYRRMLMRVVALMTYLYRAYKILDQNGKPEQIGVSLCSSETPNTSCEIGANTEKSHISICLPCAEPCAEPWAHTAPQAQAISCSWLLDRPCAWRVRMEQYTVRPAGCSYGVLHYQMDNL